MRDPDEGAIYDLIAHQPAKAPRESVPHDREIH